MKKFILILTFLAGVSCFAGDDFRGFNGTVLTNSQRTVSWTNTSQNAYYFTAISATYGLSWTGVVTLVQIAGTSTQILYSGGVTNCTSWRWEPGARIHNVSGQVVRATDDGTNGVYYFEQNF